MDVLAVTPVPLSDNAHDAWTDSLDRWVDLATPCPATESTWLRPLSRRSPGLLSRGALGVGNHCLRRMVLAGSTLADLLAVA